MHGRYLAGAQPVITPYQKAIQEGRREGGGGRRFNADTGGSNNTEDGEHLMVTKDCERG